MRPQIRWVTVLPGEQYGTSSMVLGHLSVSPIFLGKKGGIKRADGKLPEIRSKLKNDESPNGVPYYQSVPRNHYSVVKKK